MATPLDSPKTGTPPSSPNQPAANVPRRWPRPPVNTTVAGIAVVAMICFFAYQLPGTFLTTGTLVDILNQSAVPVILASGLTLVLSTGEFDLTNTATVGLGTAVLAVLISRHGFGTWSAIVVVVAISAVIGVLTGFLVTASNAHSFIVTLALASAILGVELMLSDNTTIFDNIPPEVFSIAAGQSFGLTNAIWIAALVAVFTSVLLHCTRFGRHAQAVGGNSEAAYLAGVPVRRVAITCYVILSVFAGVAAVVMFSRAAAYNPDPAGGFLLSTYAAVFLGAAVAGRKLKFSMQGTVFGVLVLIVFSTGLTQMSQPAQVINLVQGIILTVAVVGASRRRR